MYFYLVLSMMIFLVGVYGMFLSRKHIIIILISLELLLLAININFIVFAVHLDDVAGQLYVLLILTICAAESALGLAILIVYYRLRGGISIDLINLIKS